MEIKDRIREIRREHGMNQNEFGARLGISRDAVANLELGRVEPNGAIIKLICKEFAVRQEWLETGLGISNTPSNDTYIDLLAEDFGLDDVDARILKAYLRLTKDERDIIKKYIKEIQLGD